MKVFTFNGRQFTHLGFKPHVTRDGRAVYLNRWSTPCTCEGCTNVVEFSTPAGPSPDLRYWETNEPKAKAFNRDKCRQHARVLPDAAAGGRASARVSDADVAELRHHASQGVPFAVLAVWYPLTPRTIREIVAGRRRTAPQ
jgi:hypothetical protein